VGGADAHDNPGVQAGLVRARARAAMGGAVPAICISSRNCIRQPYAMVETKVVLAMLLASFRFGISDTYAIRS
jgi:cytokinin trans-hydroxylase